MDSYSTFVVERFEETRSGQYAVYRTKDGVETWTGNFGFKEGDIVEEWDYDGYCPSRIVVNGIETWNEEKRKKYWEDRPQSLQSPYNNKT